MGALALTLGGMLVSASPAAAEPTYCNGWTTHPDKYTGGGISFRNTTTGGVGWANPSFLNGNLSGVPHCYY
jgi:hypothetical protein